MFTLSKKSRRKLKGVHPDLMWVIQRALEISPIDFVVHEGTRTKVRQKLLIARGKAKAGKKGFKVSLYKHCRQADGYGHAVDLVPYYDGKLQWEDKNALKMIADAMIRAYNETPILYCSTHMRWGGAWTELITHHNGRDNTVSAFSMNHLYKEKKRAKKKKPFEDMYHFEMHFVR